MDEILIDISAMQSKASQLHTLSGKIYTIAEKMVVIKQQLSAAWVDEGFQKFNSDFTSAITKLLELQETVIAMAKVCEIACDEYQGAENNIISIL